MLFPLCTGPTGRPRDIPTRTRGEITPRCPDPVEGPTPGVLPGLSRITTLLDITGNIKKKFIIF